MTTTDGGSRARGNWRIVTWNVRGSARPDLTAIADVVRQYAPDVLAVQEIRRGQAAELARLLGWQHRWARKHHPYTPLMWWLSEGLSILSPFPLDAVQRESISPGVSTWTYRHRVLLAASANRDGEYLRIYDTHLAAHHHPDERIAQAARVAQRIRTDNAPLVVVAGDLNAAGEVEVIREFRPAHLVDPGGGPTNPAIAPRQRLDYVLIPERAHLVEQHEPAGGERWWAISDHVPVMVEFRL